MRNDCKRAIGSSRPEAPGEKPQGRTDARHYRLARIRPGTANRLTDGLGRPQRRSGTVRTLATPDKRSAAGSSLKGPKPHERRIALACLRRCNADQAAVRRRRAQAIPTIHAGDRRSVWSCAGGSARRCDDHRPRDTDGLSRRRLRSRIGRERQMRGTRHDGLDERGEASQYLASSLRSRYANEPCGPCQKEAWRGRCQQ